MLGLIASTTKCVEIFSKLKVKLVSYDFRKLINVEETSHGEEI